MKLVSTKSNIMLLKTQIQEIEKSLDHFNKTNTEVSEKGVDWHLDHTLRVINGISGILIESKPEDYKWKFNFYKTAILLKGSIPRGKGKAPKRVVATSEIIKTDVVNQIEIAKNLLPQLKKLPKKSNFNHPYFGMLNLKETQKFLKIHTNHHLKIINDIIA